jgi:hypothetical protein
VDLLHNEINMKKSKSFEIILVLFVVYVSRLSFAASETTRTYEDKERGFSFVLPNGWRPLSLPGLSKEVEHQSLSNEETDSQIKSELKKWNEHPDRQLGYGKQVGVNGQNQLAAIEILFRSLGQYKMQALDKVLTDLDSVYTKGNADSHYILEPELKTISGCDAVHAILNIKMALKGHEPRQFLKDEWLVKRGEKLFKVSMNADTANTVAKSDFSSLVESIKIQGCK